MKTPIPWQNLSHLWNDPRMTPIKNLKNQTPAKSVIFKAFKFSSYDDTKVVILGQDPYYQQGVANGLAFDCSNSNYHHLQPSLENIYDTAERENIDFEERDPSLELLAKQGVLLLNTALTTEIGSPGSHAELWAFFTEAVIEELNKKEDLVWILWGSHARSFKRFINKDHKIFEGVHPAADSYRMEEPPQFKTYFNETNQYLAKKGKPMILWFQPSNLPF